MHLNSQALPCAAGATALLARSCCLAAQAFKGYTLTIQWIDEGPSDLLSATIIPPWKKHTGEGAEDAPVGPPRFGLRCKKPSPQKFHSG